MHSGERAMSIRRETSGIVFNFYSVLHFVFDMVLCKSLLSSLRRFPKLEDKNVEFVRWALSMTVPHSCIPKNGP
jgi:hypothetical protein